MKALIKSVVEKRKKDLKEEAKRFVTEEEKGVFSLPTLVIRQTQQKKKKLYCCEDK